MAAAFPLGRVWIAGGGGMIGGALARALAARGVPFQAPARAALDCRDAAAVSGFLSRHRPDTVFLLVGRPSANAGAGGAPEAYADMTAAQQAVIETCVRHRIRRLVFAASAALYPAGVPVPTPEAALFAPDRPEPGGPYAAAKRHGLRLCLAARRHGLAYTAALPANIYGPGDRFDASGRVVGALIARMAEAARAGAEAVEVWGSGRATRDFLHADDCAGGLIRIAEAIDEPAVNVASGTETAIARLAELIRTACGFAGALRFRPDKPEGVARSCLDISRIAAAGWRPAVTLEDGVRQTCGHHLSTLAA